MADLSLDKTSQNVKNINPYKTEEYQKFIQTVENGEIPEHWQILAEALGITEQTIIRWKQLPEFQKALNKGLDKALREMQRAGGDDWKMWRERIALLRKEKQGDSMTINADKVVAILGGVTNVSGNNGN